ncbi:MAG: hypothetical protein L0Y44_12925 [Phycisphaerales bacterium]|nr:hypothetical protein [Phycisphaerales bacterium]
MLGRKGKDRITGFAGTITAYVEYLSGCNQVLMTPPVGADGKLGDANWFDVQRIELTDDPAIALTNGATPGFDVPAPIR